MASKFSILVVFLTIACFFTAGFSADEATAEKEFVLTLDHSNFSDTVSKHPFMVVEFYAPWCGHCKKLAPEFEKAAQILSNNDPPVVLAKVDANEEVNKDLATQYEIRGFPTIKILRNGGKIVQEYKGPREADGIVEYLKKQSGPASTEIKSAEDASSFIDEKKVVIVGVFPKFSGEEFENYKALAEKLRSDYEFGHTQNAKLLPRGESSVTGPVVRLFKPFDELFVDFKDFNVDALEKFVEESSIPTVTVFNNDASNHPFVVKFFNSPNEKAMLFMNFSNNPETIESKYREVAEQYKSQGISFLMGDLETSQGAFQFFGLKDSQVPLIIIQTNDGQKYLKPNVEADHIAPWFKEYKEGKVPAFRKSESIPEVNNEPVKVVVADSLQDEVFNSGKNVLIEFYAPWCGHCKKLAPILEEVAVSYQDDANVVIAKFDATANDLPGDNTFDVQGYPTVYFRSASGNIVPYDGNRTKEDIIEFIEKSRDKTSTPQEPAKTETSTLQEPAKTETVKEEPVKDEL